MKWFSWHGVRAWSAAVITLVLVGVPPAKADYRQGLAFYNSGNYAEAFIDNNEQDSGYQARTIPAGKERNRPQADRRDWVSWENGGFSLRHPEGWRAAADDRGAVSVSGPEDESVVVWPVFSTGRIDGNLALKLVASLTAELDRECRLAPAQEAMPGVFKAEGDPQRMACTAILMPVRTPRGDAATFILTRTGRQPREDLAPVFARIMESLVLRGAGRPVGPGGVTSPPDTAYTTFTDPTEGAFTADVPAGWRVEGGVARFNASDVRPWMRLVSPDGHIRVMMGDPQIPSMLVPNAPLAGMGFTEGMVYDAGYNQRFLLRSYYPGKEAARLYAENALAEGCGDAAVEDFRDRPDLAGAVNSVFRRYRSPFAEQQLDAGEISRSCPGANRAQYVFAGTLLSQIPTPQGIFAMWVMNYLYAFEAPRTEAADALAVTGRLAGSLRVTPEWARMNGGLQGRVSEIVAETGTAIAKTVSEGYWHAQSTREKGLERYGKAIRGVEEAIDPLTGRKIEIVSGKNHAWIDPRGRVVGTDTETQPGIDYRQLFLVDR